MQEADIIPHFHGKVKRFSPTHYYSSGKNRCQSLHLRALWLKNGEKRQDIVNLAAPHNQMLGARVGEAGAQIQAPPSDRKAEEIAWYDAARSASSETTLPKPNAR